MPSDGQSQSVDTPWSTTGDGDHGLSQNQNQNQVQNQIQNQTAVDQTAVDQTRADFTPEHGVTSAQGQANADANANADDSAIGGLRVRQVAVDWIVRSHMLGELAFDANGVAGKPRPVGPIINGHGPFPTSYNVPETVGYLDAKARQKGNAARGVKVDGQPDDLDKTDVTSPDTRQGDTNVSTGANSSAASLPPPAVTGHGRRTDESIDPGSAAAIAAGVANNSAAQSSAPSSAQVSVQSSLPQSSAAQPGTSQAAPSGTADGPPAPPVDELLGTTYLNKYHLESVLGAGGMGVIYQGRQIFLDRIVAIKMLKNNLASVKARMRFHQEAKAASQLNHPGIVGIIDFGVDEQDRPYMVMEHVEGCTFSDLLRERLALSVQDALPVFLEICDALSEAHHKGIVHRDLKPSNIMLVATPDGKVHTKLLDFGIAKMLDIQDQTLQGMTKTGEALGTPLYMSPEQIQGTKVTYKSDLYSLGCMLYTCLTGTPPFVGENKLRTMEKHCTTAPLPLRQASRGKDFPPGIEPIVMRLLEKNPADRFASVDELKDALIDMAVQNRYMKRPQVESAGSGQLYLTGAIPEMPKSISDMVPRNNTTQAFDALYAGTDRERTSGETDVERVFENKRSNESTLSHRYLSSFFEHTRFRPAQIYILATCLTGLFLVVVTAIFTVLVTRNNHSAALKSSKIVNSSVQNSNPQRDLKISKKDGAILTADQIIEKTVASDPKILVFSINGKKGLTDIGIQNLLKLKRVRSLDLSDSDITGAQLERLSAMHLNCLIVDGNRQISNWSLHTLSKIPTLEELSLARTGISDDGLRYLSHSKSVHTLCLGDNPLVTDAGVANLVSETSPIQMIFLNGCGITDKAVQHCATFPRLDALNIANCSKITDKSIQALMPKADKLEYLSVANDRISEASIKLLLHFKKLRVLDIAGVPLRPTIVPTLGALKQLDNLYIVKCRLPEPDVDKLEELLPSTRVFINQPRSYLIK